MNEITIPLKAIKGRGAATRNAHLEAKGRYRGEVPIDSGVVQLFRDDTFVGVASLPLVLPDDELAIATHLFRIDYEPAAPVVDTQQMLEEEEAMRAAETRKMTSLMELAGFSEEGSPTPRARPEDKPRVVRVPADRPEPDGLRDGERQQDDDAHESGQDERLLEKAGCAEEVEERLRLREAVEDDR